MSLMFFMGFICAMRGAAPAEDLYPEYYALWALFAIADALWVRGGK